MYSALCEERPGVAYCEAYSNNIFSNLQISLIDISIKMNNFYFLSSVVFWTKSVTRQWTLELMAFKNREGNKKKG